MAAHLRRRRAPTRSTRLARRTRFSVAFAIDVQLSRWRPGFLAPRRPPATVQSNGWTEDCRGANHSNLSNRPNPSQDQIVNPGEKRVGPGFGSEKCYAVGKDLQYFRRECRRF